METKVCISAMAMLLCCMPAVAETLFYDSFTRSGNLEGTSPDMGGGAYVYVPSGFGSNDTAVATGGNAYMAVESKHSGAFVNFSVRTPVTGINYATAPVFYMTATFNSSDLSKLYGGHLGVEVGIDVTKTGGDSMVREQQIGLGQSGWYGDLAEDPHTVSWGSGTQFGRFSLGDYTLGNTTMLALKFEEKLMNTSTVQYYYEIFAGVVSPSGDEPVWTKIAAEANRPAGYSLDYIGLNVGGINHGDWLTHSGYIDEIRVGTTWDDVNIPEPATILLVGAGIVGLARTRLGRKN
jgi:hypothetical protein